MAKNGGEPVILRYLLSLVGVFVIGIWVGVEYVAPHC